MLLHSGSPASAAFDEPAAVPEVTVSEDGAKQGDESASSYRPLVDFARTVRAIERERALIRQQARQELRQKQRERREIRQERRERARERAARAAERQFGQWVWPISGASMSAYFGESGSSWSSGHHTGQDFTAPYGTQVYAASGGTITFAGWSDAYGNKIEITHPDGNQTWYAHMSSLERTSGTVEPGEVIGYVGCTGNCYGNHLHFEFHPGGGAAADPIAWLRQHGAG
jgi:murein DD-endopeptidase MepM/ murein hydrolase activator NlpD